MPGVMDPGIPHPGLFEDRLPGPPVFGTFDRTAMPRGEDQIMILPGVTCPQSLSCLPLAVLLEQIQDRGRALEREFALALALPKDDASTNALRAFVGMSNAIRPTRTLVAGVTLPYAAWFASRFREIRPRRTAIVRARERMRWTLRTVLGERPRRSMTV